MGMFLCDSPILGVPVAWPLPTVLSAVGAAVAPTTSSALSAESLSQDANSPGHSAGSSSFLGPQRDSLGQSQHPIPPMSSGKIGE